MSATELSETSNPFRSRRLIPALALVLITLAIYNPIAHNGFVNFDDDRYVVNNPHVRAGLSSATVAWAFRSTEQANWHPLTWLSHALDCQLFGLNPVGHHYTNLVLHALNALLLFLILQSFTGRTGRSFLVAALFAVHPINVESVAWVAERKNVLSMFFLLLAVAAYGRYAHKPSLARYVPVALLFACGLMAKPMVITLPFVLLLLDCWPLGRLNFPQRDTPREALIKHRFSFETLRVLRGLCSFSTLNQSSSGAFTQRFLGTLIAEKLPLFALSVASAVITMIAQKAGGAVLTSASHNPALRIENAIVSYSAYLVKAFWPAGLAALYPFPHAVSLGHVAISAAVLLAITFLAFKYRERAYLLMGWLWFLGTMVPMAGLVQVGNQAMADRYAYLPMVGIFIAVVWSISDMTTGRLPEEVRRMTAVAVLLTLCGLTYVQAGYWHDDLSLWSHTLAVTHDNFVAENNFGGALTRQGHYDEAIIHFRNAAALEPGDSASQLNLGIYAQQHGDLREAAARYENSLRLTTDPQVRSSALANLGTVYFALRDYPRARQSFESALKLNQSFPVVFLDLGLITAKSAQTQEDWSHAADYFAAFTAAAPSDVGYLLLAEALRRAGRDAEAGLASQNAQQLANGNSLDQARQKAAILLSQ